jgi:probable rRNA maturation factor
MPVDVQIAVAHDQFLDVDGSLVEGLEERITAWATAVVARETALASSALSEPGISDPEVCIRVVAELESQQLNATYRGKDRPTNVLSFPAQYDAHLVEQTQLELLGDIVICAEVIAEEAREQSKNPLDHFAHMVIHGMLHLYGYDHEASPAAEKMESIEREILGRFGVSDPYQEI